MDDYIHKTTCRVCNGSDFVQVLNLGSTPPANAYLSDDDLLKPERSYPLLLYFCRTCSLAQLLDVVNPEVLFKRYRYLTSASDPSVEHFQQYALEVIRPLIGSTKDLIIDIGGNDGILLKYVKDNAQVLNVDPADNLAPLSEANGVRFWSAFFNSVVANDLLAKYGHAKVVTANNVLAHTDPIRDVFAGVSTLIGEQGTFIFEVHWVKHLLEEGAFDQIYHDHLCFYSLYVAKRLVEIAGMNVFDAEIVPTQGKSLRIHVAKAREPSPRVACILAEEKAFGVAEEQTYLAFSHRVQNNRQELLALLRTLKAEGKRIVGYGAPAKGNTLLNYCGLGTETIEYLTDTTFLKQGLYSPGKHIPIVSPDMLIQRPPDYILLLAWNFKDAILRKETTLRARGVKFIVPIPKVEVL